MNLLPIWRAVISGIDQHWLVARLLFASVELAVLAVAATLVLKLVRPRTPRLVALVWALVLAKSLATLAIGSPWAAIQVPVSTPQNFAQQLSSDQHGLPVAANGSEEMRNSSRFRPAEESLNQPPAAAQNSEGSISTPPVQNDVHATAGVSWFWSMLTWLWLAGVLVMVARAVWIRRRLASILAGCRNPDDEMRRLYADVCASLKLSKSPPLFITDALESPALVGPWRPNVLVPTWLATKTDRAALTWSLRHELTHWKQGDLWFIRLRELACTAFYFHPGAWWASRRMEEALEIACDRALVASDAEAADYASRLYQILDAVRQQRGQPLSTGLFATRSQIAKRLVMLLESPLRLRPKLTAAATIGFITLAALVFALGIGLRHEAGAEEKPYPVSEPVPGKSDEKSGDHPAVKSQADDSSSDKSHDDSKSTDQKSAGQTPPAQQTVAVDGTVVDESGQPVSGVAVRYFFGTGQQPTLTTDAEGRFHISIPLKSGVLIVADDTAGQRQGYANHGVAVSDKSTLPKPTTIKPIVLKPLRQTKLKVVGTQGMPVAGATYAAPASKYYLGNILFTGVTDANGEATLRYTDDALVHQIVALKSGVGFDYFISPLAWDGTGSQVEISDDAKLGKPLPEEITLRLTGARTLKCIAKTPEGQAIPATHFDLRTIRLPGKASEIDLHSLLSKPFTVVTDAAGIATFDWLPHDFVGQMRFSCSAQGYSSQRDFGAPDPLVLHAQQPVDELHATMWRPVKISGHVYLSDGQPAAGIKMQCQVHIHGYFGPFTTAADGSFQITVEPPAFGTYTVLLNTKDDRWAAHSQQITISDNKDIDNLKFNVVEGTTVRGTVSEGPDKKPVPGQLVQLIEIDSRVPLVEGADPSTPTGFVRRMQTDADGLYHFCVAPGDYVVHLPSLNTKVIDWHHFNFTVTGQQREMTFDFALPQIHQMAPEHLSGKVVDADGKPVANANVLGIYPESFDRLVPDPRAKTAADGTFEFDRYAALLLVRIGDRPNWFHELGGAFVKPDQKEVTIQALPPVEAHGRLVDEHGQPVAGEKGWLATRIELPAGMDALGTGERFFSEPDGTFTLTGLIPGIEYGVYYSERGKPELAAKLTTFTPVAGKTTELGDTALPGTLLPTPSAKSD